MNPTIQRVYECADKAIASALAKANAKPPCCSGCFHCCREAVYCELTEVEGMLESLTPQQIEVVVERARSWLLRFQMSGLGRRNRPPATEYRAEYLWCPFLEGGKCMAYDRRPLACRAHFALESADGCIQDHLRSRQLFALFPEMGETLVSARCRELEDGESATWDHLGLLVSKILLGVDEPSAIRTLATARGDTLELQTYTDEAVKE